LRSDILERWKDWSWPGNVRELRNAVARQLTLGDERVLHAEPVQSSMSAFKSYLEMPFIQGRDRLLEEFEQAFVEHWLGRFNGDIGKAAEATGIGRRYFQKLRARRKA
jgi:DNA-binding NtrC family response regulator